MIFKDSYNPDMVYFLALWSKYHQENTNKF